MVQKARVTVTYSEKDGMVRYLPGAVQWQPRSIADNSGVMFLPGKVRDRFIINGDFFVNLKYDTALELSLRHVPGKVKDW
jgi:hypothetical protein